MRRIVTWCLTSALIVAPCFSQLNSYSGATLSPTSISDADLHDDGKYLHFSHRSAGEDLRKKLSESPSEVPLVVHTGEGIPMQGSPKPGAKKLNLLESLSCEADSVVVTTVISHKAHFSDDNTFIYTAFRVEISEVIKTNSDLSTGQVIIVARAGGSITNGLRTVTVISDGFSQFRDGDRLVLFLIREKETGDFQAFRSGSFSLTGATLLPYVNAGYWNSQRLRSAAFLAMVKGSSSADCNGSSRTAHIY